MSILSPFLSPPELLLQYCLLDGTEQQIVFALPLLLPHFLLPLQQLSPAAALQLWFDESLYCHFTSLRLSPAAAAAGVSFLQQTVSLGGRLAIIKDIKHAVAQNSLFAAGELLAIGDMKGDSKAIVRLTPAAAAAAATHFAAAVKLQVKAQDPRLAASLYELLVYLLEEPQ